MTTKEASLRTLLFGSNHFITYVVPATHSWHKRINVPSFGSLVINELRESLERPGHWLPASTTSQHIMTSIRYDTVD